MEIYDQFVSELLTEKGISATPEQRTALLNNIDQAVNNALLEALPTESLKKLEEAKNANQVDDDIIERMMAEAGIDPSKVVQKALEDYKSKFLQEVK